MQQSFDEREEAGIATGRWFCLDLRQPAANDVFGEGQGCAAAPLTTGDRTAPHGQACRRPPTAYRPTAYAQAPAAAPVHASFRPRRREPHFSPTALLLPLPILLSKPAAFLPAASPRLEVLPTSPPEAADRRAKRSWTSVPHCC